MTPGLRTVGKAEGMADQHGGREQRGEGDGGELGLGAETNAMGGRP